MNYGKKGIKKKQKKLHSNANKLGKMFLLTFLKAFLFLVLAIGISGICLGIGAFKGILASAPDISNLDYTPSGYATVVYDCKGTQISKLVSADSNRSYVNIESIPQELSDAFVAIEDVRFYEHNGIDIKGIIRAGYNGVTSGHFSEGASTITQQLLKNNVFDNWVNESDMEKVRRKIQEQYLALELEKKLTGNLGSTLEAKRMILELYMNTINLGQNTLGVQAASMRYFNKPVSQLTLSECAVIASITQNPAKFNPISHPDYNAERREKVLNNMKEQGYITETEYQIALKDNVYDRIETVNAEVATTTVNSYFVDELIEQVIDALVQQKGYSETQAYKLVYSGGLQIYTTQDPDIQKICDDVFKNEENYPSDVKWYLNYELTILKADESYENHSTEMFKAYYKQSNPNFDLIYSSQDDAYAAIEQYKEAMMSSGDEVYGENVTLTPQPQVSITVEDQHTGYIVAMVGGRGTKSASRTVNRASNTLRQPGSTFKVLSTYAPALDSAGLTLATVQNDAPYNYANGRPVANWYGESYRGLCSLRYGIEQSLNIVAVKTLTQITPQLGFDYLQDFGFTTLVERREMSDGTIYSDIQQATALGGLTDGVTNLELNAAYAAIANNGTYIKPTLFTKIIDHDGNILIDNTEPERHQVIKETTAFLLTDAMVDVVTKGTGTAVNFGDMSIAGKTGTTSKYKDVWFAGYTPYYTATTWTGYDNNLNLAKSEQGLSKSLWRQVMSQIHENLPNKSFDKPSGIVTATVCSKSGKLPIAGVCDGSLRTEYFAEGTVPSDHCNVHYQGMVCQATGKAAVSTCPYQVPGVIESPPNDDGTSSISYCPHTMEYFANPDNLAQIQAQQAAQQAAAQQAAQQAAAQQAAQQQAAQQAQQGDGQPTQ
ncbi:MAG: transglycosylase domain-containing protein [Lachnospiraceae bacterium]|nr:transglycosylase domain-containing protein [Lachnospiraceae bacterium]